MSKIQVDNIVNKSDNGAPGFPYGAVITGIATVTTLSATTITATTYNGIPATSDWRDASLFS